MWTYQQQKVEVYPKVRVPRWKQKHIVALTDWRTTCPTDRGSEGEQLAYSLTQLTGSVRTATPPHSPHPATLTFLLVRRNNQQSVSGSALPAARAPTSVVFTLLPATTLCHSREFWRTNVNRSCVAELSNVGCLYEVRRDRCYLNIFVKVDRTPVYKI